MNANLSQRLWKAFVAMLIMALVVLTGGMAYEAIGRLLDARPFPVRGRMVDIGRYRLNINCTGIGSPAGILESGLGESARSWIGVQSGVERFTRVCSYDRAGYGQSEPGPQPLQPSNCQRATYSIRENADARAICTGRAFLWWLQRAGLYRSLSERRSGSCRFLARRSGTVRTSERARPG